MGARRSRSASTLPSGWLSVSGRLDNAGATREQIAQLRMYGLRELLRQGTREIMNAPDTSAMSEGQPYDPCRSQLLQELMALPQPLTVRSGTNKRPQYYVDITGTTLRHARMSIASASFFVDDSMTSDGLVVFRGLTRNGNKWRVRIEKVHKGRNGGHPTYTATIKMAGTVFENRMVAGSRSPQMNNK